MLKNLRHYLRRNTKERIFNKTVDGSPAGERQTEWESGGKGERGGEGEGGDREEERRWGRRKIRMEREMEIGRRGEREREREREREGGKGGRDGEEVCVWGGGGGG